MITTLQFEEKIIHVYSHETVLSALKRNDIPIAAGCGGKNRCGSCRIKLLSGTFCADGKFLTVDTPVEVNACSLKMLSNGSASYPDKKITSASKPEHLRQFIPEIPADQPAVLLLDLGTTNIEALLIQNGKILQTGQVNKQTLFGDNIIERIAFANSPEKEELLHKVLLSETCIPLICSLTDTPENIRQVIVSGNTAMTHFFFKKDTSCLGQAPFQPEQTEFEGTAESTGLTSLSPDTPVKAFPCLGGFIGGDITSGLLLTGFGKTDICELYMDLGTNCEIMLNDRGKFYALSTAAGPAFERNNLRGDHLNVIRHLEFDGLKWQLYPGTDSPAGYCGTALIDLLAEGKRHGFLDKFARWISRPALPEKLIPPPSALSELVTAKAAIESGWQLLFKRAEISPMDIERIYIAGNFAENLNITNAVLIGILPDLPLKKFIKCGNAALYGMIAGAVQNDWTKKVQKFKSKTMLINPAEEPDYMRLFTSAMTI